MESAGSVTQLLVNFTQVLRNLRLELRLICGRGLALAGRRGAVKASTNILRPLFASRMHFNAVLFNHFDHDLVRSFRTTQGTLRTIVFVFLSLAFLAARSLDLLLMLNGHALVLCFLGDPVVL